MMSFLYIWNLLIYMDKTFKASAFEKVAQKLKMKIKRIRPYSPWQNGKVERSHREDGKIVYNKKYLQEKKI